MTNEKDIKQLIHDHNTMVEVIEYLVALVDYPYYKDKLETIVKERNLHRIEE